MNMKDDSKQSLTSLNTHENNSGSPSLITTPPCKGYDDKGYADSGSTSTATMTPQLTQPVIDRGYAWVIMLAVFFTFMLQMTITSSGTILYQIFLGRYELSATEAGWIISLPLTVRFFSTPLVALIHGQLSYRSTSMLGSILLSVGVLVQAFANDVWMLYLGSIMMGFGSNMIILSSLIILPLYFKMHLGKAMSFTMCGLGVGGMLTPPLFTYSMVTYGYTQSMILMSCVVMHTVVSSALYRPQKTTRQTTSVTSTPLSASRSKWHRFKTKSGLVLLCRPVLVYLMLVVISFHCLMNTVAVYVSGLAIERANMTARQIALTLSIGSFSEFSRLLFGACYDFKSVRAYRMYLFCGTCLLMGVFTILLSFTWDVITFITCFVTFTVMTSATHSQYVTMLTDMVTSDELPQTVTLSRSLMGIFQMVVPPAIGRIKDQWRSFQYGFILLSGIHIAIVSGYIVTYYCWSKRQILDVSRNQQTDNDSEK